MFGFAYIYNILFMTGAGVSPARSDLTPFLNFTSEILTGARSNFKNSHFKVTALVKTTTRKLPHATSNPLSPPLLRDSPLSLDALPFLLI